jgi:hypothetical protein
MLGATSNFVVQLDIRRIANEYLDLSSATFVV